jgi:hypothetical protein
MKDKVTARHEALREEYSSSANQKHIENIRNHFNLRVIREGMRRCLKCDKKFKSVDLAYNKMCTECGTYRDTSLS